MNAHQTYGLDEAVERIAALYRIENEIKVRSAEERRTIRSTTHTLHRRTTWRHDKVIASILNRQERKTANGERFTAVHVGGLRRYGVSMEVSMPLSFNPRPASLPGESRIISCT